MNLEHLLYSALRFLLRFKCYFTIGLLGFVVVRPTRGLSCLSSPVASRVILHTIFCLLGRFSRIVSPSLL